MGCGLRMKRENTQRAILIRFRRVGVYLREILLQVMTVQNFLDEVRIRIAHNLKLAPEKHQNPKIEQILEPMDNEERAE